jgi:outer membrane protein TolC
LNSQIGLQKNFSFGLQTSLLLNATQAAIKGQQLGTGTINSTQWATQPSFELKLPLLSGAWGKKIQAEYRALVLRKSIEYLSSEVEYENKTNAAKVFFWSSVLQKGLVDSKKQTYERIASLYKIISKKRAQNLEGTSNFLQAKSAIEQTELDLKESELSLNQFERLLKLAINKSYDFSFQKYDFKKFGKAKKSDFFNKITSNEKILILSEDLQNTLTVSTTEDYRPKLDLFASYAFNGVESEWSDSLSEVAKNKQPTTFIGLKWAVPLDQNLVRRAQDRQAALANISKAKMS